MCTVTDHEVVVYSPCHNIHFDKGYNYNVIVAKMHNTIIMVLCTLEYRDADHEAVLVV